LFDYSAPSIIVSSGKLLGNPRPAGGPPRPGVTEKKVKSLIDTSIIEIKRIQLICAESELYGLTVLGERWLCDPFFENGPTPEDHWRFKHPNNNKYSLAYPGEWSSLPL
jgi:hypothetical protein